MQRCSRIMEEEARRVGSGEDDQMKLGAAESTEQGRIGSGLAPCSTVGSKKKAGATRKKKAGKGGAVKEGSTKRKAAAGSSKEKKAATGPPAAAAGGVPEGEKLAADVAMAAAEDAGVAECTPGTLIELPQYYVDWILSQKRRVLEEDPDDFYNRMISDPDRPEFYTVEYLENERQLMRDMAEQYRQSGDYLEKFQESVRVQLETKGRVLVDETFVARQASLRQAFKEFWTAMMRDE